MKDDSGSQFLFVYGTLRRDSRHEMYQLLARNSAFLGEASFRGRLFLVDDFPGVIRSYDRGYEVRGEVYRLERPHAVLPRLDAYEEYDPQSPETSLYRRELEEVVLDNGRRVDAWVYLYNRPTDGLPEIPSGDFLQLAGQQQRPRKVRAQA